MTAERLNYQAVLLAGFGGPEAREDVMPFLRNVTRGRGIPEERLVEVSHHYYALGGVSPINEQNRALQAALQVELDGRGRAVPVLWGNRNWQPYFADVIRAAAAHGTVDLLAVATSAYSSYSSCRQYREDFGGALAATELVGRVRIDKVRPYFDLAGFLDPVVDGCVASMEKALAQIDLPLIIDLAAVHFLDSSAIGVMALMFRHCQERHLPMAIFNANPQPEAVLAMAGLSDYVTVYPDLKSALNALA